MAKYAFGARYYRDAFPFVSSDSTRAKRARILFATDGTIVATDGYTLLALQLDAASHVAPPRDVIIPQSKALFSACKDAKRDAPKYVVIDQTDPTSRDVTIDVVHAETAVEALEPAARSVFTLCTKLHDATIPAWRDNVPAMPEQAPAAAPTFRVRYLAKFGRVASGGGIRVIPAGGDSAAAYVYLGRDDAFGLILPMNYSRAISWRAAGKPVPLPAVPAWARRAS